MKENKMGKYFKYAIGEIILVVIGILIALQINNWNENRKSLQDQKATIASLKLEFQKNLVDLKANISDIEAILSAGSTILEYTGPDYQEGMLKNLDSLIGMTVRMAVWDPSLYTLSNIKSSGKLSNLTNNVLKEQLIEWESFYTNLLNWYEFYVAGGEKYFDYLEQHSLLRNITSSAPFSFGTSRFKGANDHLLNIARFENILIQRNFQNGFILEYYKEAQERLTNIIQQCETYED